MFKPSRAKTPQDVYKEKLEEMSTIVYAWNLTEIHDYVMCKNDLHVCNFLGFDAIMEKFNTHMTINKEYPKGRREFEITDKAQRTKKGFDIVVFLCKHPRSNVKTMLGIQQFMKLYMDVIREYDKLNEGDYREKLLNAFRKGLFRLESKAKEKR